MVIGQLSDEFAGARPTLLLTPEEVLDCIVRATRYYAAFGNIASLAQSNSLPGSDGFPPEPEPDPAPVVSEALPVKGLELIDEYTEVTVGEWAVISPLFNLYVERETAMRLEASRAGGIEVYGRSVSEIQNDITSMEQDMLPQRAFSHAVITIGP